MSDLINRQDVIEAFWKLDIELRPSAIDAITDMLKTLPSAEPERKRGEWKFRSPNILYPESERYKCSVCGGHSYIHDYCPNCGADMRGGHDETD